MNQWETVEAVGRLFYSNSLYYTRTRARSAYRMPWIALSLLLYRETYWTKRPTKSRIAILGITRKQDSSRSR